MCAIIVSAVQADPFLEGAVLYRARQDDGVVQISYVQAHISKQLVVHPGSVQSDGSVLVRDI